jgi:hypothetical protein
LVPDGEFESGNRRVAATGAPERLCQRQVLSVLMVYEMKIFVFVLAAMLGTGCSALLPHGERKVTSEWDSFEDAKTAFDRVVPYETREDDLEMLGFSPAGRANVRILNHADIGERFMPVILRNGDNLPEGLRSCLARTDDCYAYEVERRVTRDQRFGNFFADFMNFKRRTKIEGWEFNALILLLDRQVVYKLWSGTPDINEYHEETNPLGPLQGIGPSMAPSLD